MRPCLVQRLHKQRVAFDSARVVLLHDGHVTAGTSDIANVKEVVAAISFLCDLGLFAFMTIVKSDDGSRGSIWRIDVVASMCRHKDIVVVVPAMDLELLIVGRLVVDGKNVRHNGCGD